MREVTLVVGGTTNGSEQAQRWVGREVGTGEQRGVGGPLVGHRVQPAKVRLRQPDRQGEGLQLWCDAIRDGQAIQALPQDQLPDAPPTLLEDPSDAEGGHSIQLPESARTPLAAPV